MLKNGGSQHLHPRHTIQHIPYPALLLCPECREVDLGILGEKDRDKFPQAFFDIGGQCIHERYSTGLTAIR